MSSLARRPSFPPAGPPAGAAPAVLRFERSHAAALLAYGLTLLALTAGVPAVLLWSAAPDVTRAIAVLVAATALPFAVLVWLQRHIWLTTVVVVTGEVLEVRRASLPLARVPLRDVRRMRLVSAVGLVVWVADGRSTCVGRLGPDATARLLARLESRTGVPVEGTPPDDRD